MIEIETTKKYNDVTNEWLLNSTPNNYKVKIAKYYKYNNVKYYIDGKLVILDFTQKEKEIAVWLAKNFGGKIYILPRINYPQKIKTSKLQTDNIILDITDTSICKENIIKQVENVFSTSGREWLKRIIIIDNYSLIKIYERK